MTNAETKSYQRNGPSSLKKKMADTTKNTGMEVVVDEDDQDHDRELVSILSDVASPASRVASTLLRRCLRECGCARPFQVKKKLKN